MHYMYNPSEDRTPSVYVSARVLKYHTPEYSNSLQPAFFKRERERLEKSS